MIKRIALLLGVLFSLQTGLSFGASHRTANFIVFASTTEAARDIAVAAEQYRHDLAIEWLGRALVDWDEPCPITVRLGDNLRSSGETSFVFRGGQPFHWQMSLVGSKQSIRQSVLPHEVTHTIFATHFGKPLPRWAEEGACVTVEDARDRSALENVVYLGLSSERAFAIEHLITLREYPQDVVAFYAQGYSLVRFLVEHGGRQKFIRYLNDGLRQQDWRNATEKHYGYPSITSLQNEWAAWAILKSP